MLGRTSALVTCLLALATGCGPDDKPRDSCRQKPTFLVTLELEEGVFPEDTRVAFEYGGGLEVFELRTRSLKQHDHFRVALDHLRRAEDLFRRGHWRETLAACRESFESAASATAGSPNVAVGFAQLWEQVLPRDAEAPKRPMLNEMVHALSAFLHIGRHSRVPFLDATEHDALLGLRMTLTLFEYMSLQLAVAR